MVDVTINCIPTKPEADGKPRALLVSKLRSGAVDHSWEYLVSLTASRSSSDSGPPKPQNFLRPFVLRSRFPNSGQFLDDVAGEVYFTPGARDRARWARIFEDLQGGEVRIKARFIIYTFTSKGGYKITGAKLVPQDIDRI